MLEVSGQISRAVESRIVAAVEQHFRKTLHERIDQSVLEFLAKPIQPTNSYGEKKGEPVTLTELIAKSGIEHLNEKVSARGERASYGDDSLPRHSWLARKMSEDHLKAELKPVLDKAVADAKGFITNKVAVALKEAMAAAIK